MTLNFTSKLVLAAGLVAMSGASPALAFDLQVGGVYYNKLPNNTVEVTYGMTSGCYSGTVTVPETITDYAPETPVDYTVVAIGENAFYGCDELFKVNLPSSLTTIKGRAFNNCTKLKNLTLPESLTSIQNDAFNGCRAFTSLEIPSSITSLPDFMCYGCEGLTSVTIPESVTEIGESVFYDCKSMKEFVLPEGITSIGRYAFSYCSDLEKINIPEGVTVIEDYAFMWCKKLTTVNIPAGVTDIKQFAFYKDESIPAITIPAGVTHIGEMAFAACVGINNLKFEDSTADLVLDNAPMADVLPIEAYVGRNLSINMFEGNHNLTSIEIGGEVTAVPNSFFKNCTVLENLILGNKIESIGNDAFTGCAAIRNVTSLSFVPPVLNTSFAQETYSEGKLSVPKSAIDTYKNANEWKNFTTFEGLDIDDAVQSVETETDATEYYTLAGTRVNGNLNPGLYICRKGNKTSKILVK